MYSYKTDVLDRRYCSRLKRSIQGLFRSCTKCNLTVKMGRPDLCVLNSISMNIY